MNVLVVAEVVRGQLREVSRELVSAGSELGRVTLALLAAEPADLVPLCELEGVAEIVTVRLAGEFEPDTYALALQALIEARQPDLTILGFTSNSIGYGPAVAARLGLGFASDVYDLRLEGGALVATRSFYGYQVVGELEFPPDNPVLLLLRPKTWPPATSAAGAKVTELVVLPARSRTRHLEFTEPELAIDIDIAQAPFLISIGGAVKDTEGVARFQRLAEAMGGTLSSSRPPVDRGLLPPSRLVGLSGRAVKPKVYFAFGISGAVQHLAGMNEAQTVLAVNLDPEAPIFSVADYGAVADVFEVADELERLY
jgi:electron transfer flavoprotein alpha subunit